MRRFIVPLVGSFIVLGLLADTGWAQGFRRGAGLRSQIHAPAPLPPFNALTMGFNSPFAGFPPISPFTGLPAGRFSGFPGFNSSLLAGLPPITPFNLPAPNFTPPIVPSAFSPQTVVRSTPGVFNPSTGAFAPSATGAFRLSRHGGFEPLTGNFMPTPTGNFTLSVREAVNPNTGTLFPSPTGNVLARERGNFRPASGAFTNATTGAVNPLTGAFVPTAIGSSTLASRSLFVPTTGTFFASGTGPFVLSTRQAFDPTTGTFMPSATGTFISTLRGNFVPASGTGSLGTSNPFNPFNQNAFTGSPFFSRWLATNTYLAALQGYNPLNPLIGVNPGPYFNPYSYSSPPVGYAASSSMPAPYAYPYSSGSYASTPYVAPSYGSASNYSASSTIPTYTGNAAQSKQQPVLAAFGIPNEDGAVKWPLAFRLMTPEQKRDRLDELEAELKVAATQAATGQANPAVLRRAKEDVESLRAWLHAHRLDIAEEAYRDAEGFLANIEKGLKAMRSSY